MDHSQMIYALLKDIFFILEDGDRTHFSRYDLTVPRFYALKHIGEQPGISLSQLSTRTLSDKGNISRIVRGMEADGLVVRQQDATDGRALCLYLTEEGERLRQQTVQSHDAYNEARLAPITMETDHLLETLQEVRDALSTHLTRERA